MTLLNSLEIGDSIPFGDCRVTKIRDGIGPLVITINGFMSENNQNHSDWSSLLSGLMPASPWIHLHWPASNLNRLLKEIVSFSPDMLMPTSLKGKSMIAKPFTATAMEWKKALENAEEAGRQLGRLLEQVEDSGIILAGHSLGARVIFNVLDTLSPSKSNVCSAALLLGGAVSHNADSWTPVFRKFQQLQISNCYSHNDTTLTCLYRLGTLFSNKPCGLTRIESLESNNIYNFNMSHIVSGHTAYKDKIVGDELTRRLLEIQEIRGLMKDIVGTASDLRQVRSKIEKEEQILKAQLTRSESIRSRMKAAIDKL